jgi:hypothetical protein
MTERFADAAVPGLIIGSVVAAAVGGLPPWVPGMMSIAAATIAVYDYGRKGGAAKQVNPSARAFASAGAAWAAVAVIASAALAATPLPVHLRFALAVLGLVVALAGAGVRAGLAASGSAPLRRGPGIEWASVVAAAVCAGAAGFQSDPQQRTILLVASALLAAAGYLGRPVSVRAAVSR